MTTSSNEKIRIIMNTLVDYLYESALELSGESGKTSEVKGLVSALKTVIDIMNEVPDTENSRTEVMEGLREFFYDLNEGDKKTERGS